MFESEVLSQRGVHNLDRHCDKCPALVADVGFVAACTYLVVVREIYIEDQFFGNWSEGLGFRERLSIPRIRIVDWADFETRRIESENIFAEPGTGSANGSHTSLRAR